MKIWVEIINVGKNKHFWFYKYSFPYILIISTQIFKILTFFNKVIIILKPYYQSNYVWLLQLVYSNFWDENWDISNIVRVWCEESTKDIIFVPSTKMEMEKWEGVRVLSDTWWFLFISFTNFVKRKYTNKNLFIHFNLQGTKIIPHSSKILGTTQLFIIFEYRLVD